MKEVLFEEKYIVESDFIMWSEDGLVYAEFSENTHITLDTIQRFVQQRKTLSKGLLIPFIINIDHIASIQHTSLILLFEQIDQTNSICKALVYSTEKSELMARIIQSTCLHSILTKSFDSILDANQWAENLKLYSH